MTASYDDLQPLLSATQVAEYLQIPRASVYRIPESELPRLTVGQRRTRFRRADLERYVRGSPARPDADPSVRALVDALAEATVGVLREILDDDDVDRALSLMSDAWSPILEGTED